MVAVFLGMFMLLTENAVLSQDADMDSSSVAAAPWPLNGFLGTCKHSFEVCLQ